MGHRTFVRRKKPTLQSAGSSGKVQVKKSHDCAEETLCIPVLIGIWVRNLQSQLQEAAQNCR